MTFEEYARSRLSGLLRLAGVLSGDSQLAEDVVQEVLLRTARQWSRIQASSSPDAYVRRMIVNEYLSWRRKWARIVPRAHIETGLNVVDHAANHAERDEMAERLARLPSRQRTVLVLRYYEDLSDDEIARLMGCTRGTVRSNASRGLATLRIEFTEPALLPTRKDT